VGRSIESRSPTEEGNPMTKWHTLTAAVLGAAAFATGVPAALADAPSTSPRADDTYVVMCVAPGATGETAYERVDAHAVDFGNKDDQVARYGDLHPGWSCRVVPG
jgi:hypothetical protein